MLQKMPPTAQALKQNQLAQHCFWDACDQVLWIDCRSVFPDLGVFSVLSWDAFMMDSSNIPQYPSQLKVLDWPQFSSLADWRKLIPKWVQDSCALFSTHQLTLLHYAGKYPQVLELLDHAPMLAWRLVSSTLEEAEIVALLVGKWQNMVAQIGWPNKKETVKFLRNLRLRMVDEHVLKMVDVCLMDHQRLTALQGLPRINSMALSLAALFPDLIGSRLHHALAQLPCRPMQCQSMVALFQDIYALAEWLGFSEKERDKIGQCRYLIEVNEWYQKWLKHAIERYAQQHHLMFIGSAFEHAQNAFIKRLSNVPVLLTEKQDRLFLSQYQQHAWWLEESLSKPGLWAWSDDDGVWGALMDLDRLNYEQRFHSNVVRIRGGKNSLPGAKQLAMVSLCPQWFRKQNRLKSYF